MTTKVIPLFLKPVLQDKMWGGTELRRYHYQLNSDHVGEAWIASTYGNDLSVVENEPYAGQTLKEIWKKHPELFGGHPDHVAFPLLVKILDAKENLSIQVHPSDENAQKYFNERNGKTECWYILDAKLDSQVYYGHSATSKDEIWDAIKHHELDRILETQTVQPGEMIYVPAGTLHSLGAGIVALEVEQNSDNTLRFYDFDRVNQKTGKKRPLQIDDAIKVTNTPNILPAKDQTKRVPDPDNPDRLRLLKSKYFNVYQIAVENDTKIKGVTTYSVNVVVDGDGTLVVNGTAYPVKKGDTYILPVQVKDYELKGHVVIVQAIANQN
ncbi:mannose-6-phosphate isomerase [Fructilactobacillus fructivorans]|uniref:type I phosphomannose isomerase catalytic subunit n=1 Tax=Fructilactobacillus fructivorans TaxID=1614 RepID=UPI000704DE16|nr:type I phosphomannose isomerase catalytic subunit [Fructilactobacillus fructivorans]KRN12384.1 mannose-6-phosphate isomerase [Fructilactobacillus fructivorans]